MAFRFIDYLAAKKSVDDRALNRHVLLSLLQRLPAATTQEPLHVLEVAAGIGTMLERLVDWRVLGSAIYTAVDLQPDCIAEALRRLPAWAQEAGFVVQQTAETTLHMQRAEQQIMVQLETIDVVQFIERERHSRRWDLVIAHAFLDLVNPAALLPDLFSLLKPAGLFYFTLNFDGATILQPEIDPLLDREIIRLYHRDMDNKRVGGESVAGSESGRKLFGQLRAAGATIIDAGSSDWVLFAGDRNYPASEADFLHFIIDTIGDALQDQTPFDIEPWIAERHEQIERGELVYIAHQIDFVGRVT
jgi:SAM-dependent methyltransferase